MRNNKNIRYLRQTAPCPYELFLPAAAGRHPLVCITPLLGRLIFLEDLFFERRWARSFARSGFAALLIHRPIFNYAAGRGLDQIQQYIKDSIGRNKAVLDAVLRHPEVSPEGAADFGVSFGSVINLLWAGEDKRLQRHVWALAGGPLSEIFMRSKDPLMASYRKAAEQASGLRKADLQQKLENEFRPDILHTARSLASPKGLLILGRFDRVVPYAAGLKLKQALDGSVRTVVLPVGHYGALLAAPYLKHLAVGFLKGSLPGAG